MHIRSKFILYAVILLICFEAGFQIGHKDGLFSHKCEPFTKVDTLLVYDTIMAYKPIIEEKRIVETVKVPVIDSVTVHDTLFVYLEREQVMWEDSLARVYASGIMPKVDSVQHFVREKIITVEHFPDVRKKFKWGLGLQAGYGVSKEGLSPYIGVGVSYNILSW